MDAKQSLPMIIVILLISILFFPQDNPGLVTIPLALAAILGLIYWRMGK